MVTLRQKRVGLKQYTKYKHTNTNTNVQYDDIIKPNSVSTKVLQEWYRSFYLSRDEWIRNKTTVLASKTQNKNEPIIGSLDIPTPILQFIQTKTLEQNTFVFNILDQTITVRLSQYSEKQLSNEYVEKCLECIYTWIHFIQPYRQSKCSKELTISIYLTPFQKELPTQSNELIDRINVNTAFTYACEPKNKIELFREEEWMKVLFHETFHSFGIDFSHLEDASQKISSQIQSRFHLHTPPAVYEAYTEVCAEIMNILYVCLMSSNMITFDSKMFYTHLNTELNYSFYQCVKVLDHSNTKYKEVSQTSSHKYKEKNNVHVFSYFLLKTMLMFSFDEFVHYIQLNGGFCFECSKRSTADKLQHLYEIITSAADNTVFIKEMQKQERILSKHQKQLCTKQLFKKISNVCGKRRTLRMTSISVK